MAPQVRLALCLCVAACSSIKGEWEGDCKVTVYEGYTMNVDVELDVKSVKGRDVDGEVTIQVGGAGPCSQDVDVEGSYGSGNLELEGDYVYYGGYNATLTIDADLSGGDLEGECAATSQGYTYQGELDLSRK